MQEVIEQLRDARAAKTEQDIVFQRETAALKAELEHLREEASSAATNRIRLERLEIELDVTRAKHLTELTTRQGLEKRLKDTEQSFSTLQQDVNVLQSGAKTRDVVAQERLDTLEQERIESAATVERLEAENKKLQEELQLVRRERDDLNTTIRDKEVTLREQASIAERSLRDHIAETDGDRGESLEVRIRIHI